MNWLECINKAIQYIESHLEDDIKLEDISKECYVSLYYLQMGFQIFTGYTLYEYIRNRKLYQASLDIINGSKIISVAYKYGYLTPESFSKAFKRFHGINPSKATINNIKIFYPLKIDLNLIGGAMQKLDYKITNMFDFKLIGFVKEFDMKDAYQKIPLFWDEICEKYCYPHIYQGLPAENEYEQAIMDNCIGEYGVCIDCKESKFKYLIAGKYTGGVIPEGMIVYTFKQGKWAIFDCYGKCPEKLQELNTLIFKEWLPNTNDIEIRDEGNIEWYDCVNGEKSDDNYHTQIWLPIK